MPLPSDYLRKASNQELFFKVSTSPFDAILEGSKVASPYYMVLYNEKNILGIKPKDEDESKVFFVENQELFDAGKMLSEKISKNIIHIASFTNHRQNRSFFIFRNQETEAIEEGLFTPDNKELLDKLRKYGFQPTIIAENGFDYSDKVVFYLLVSLPDNYETIMQNGFLTISKYRYQPYFKREESLIEDIKANCVLKFEEGLEDFIKSYEELDKIQLSNKEQIAVSLDIYNKNRNIQALKSDSRHLNETKKFIKRAKNFYAQYTNNASEIIKFIISTHPINFKEEHIRVIDFKEILTEKRAYANSKRLFKGKNTNQKERAIYVAEQLRVLGAVEKLL